MGLDDTLAVGQNVRLRCAQIVWWQTALALADAHRALGNWADVDALWAELGEASPSAELVVEGRIVVAGAKADQGDLTSAIRLLEQNWKPPKRPMGHHLRLVDLVRLDQVVTGCPRCRIRSRRSS